MRRQKIVCPHCGSIRVSKDPKMTHASAQEISMETGEPIGKLTTFIVFKCMSCGEGVYLEKFEAPEPPD